MMKIVAFKDVNVDEEFIYLARTYRKVIKPNGKIGALDTVSQQIYPDCNRWTTCYVSRSDTNSETITANSNRTNFSIINNEDGELYDIISLTPSQIRLLKWLCDHDFISEDIVINETSPIKVTEI